MSDPYIDVAAILAGTHTERTTTRGGTRDDGTRMLYEAASNVLVGAPEAGKTMVAAGMAVDELNAGGSVLWLDLDHNGAAAIVRRLIGFGASESDLVSQARFRLAMPETQEDVSRILECEEPDPATLAVIDSIGELVPMFGGNSNDADDYTRVNRAVMARLAGYGTAVLSIDHEAKGENSRAYGATGTAAKKRAVDGAMLRVTNLVPFVPGAEGSAALGIIKDRHGYLRSNAQAGHAEPTVAVFHVSHIGSFTFASPKALPPKRTDVDVLADLVPAPSSVRDIRTRLGWGSDRAATALRTLRTRVPGTYPSTEGSGVPVYPSPLGEVHGYTSPERESGTPVAVGA